MADQPRKPKNKRQRKNGHELGTKHQKPTEIEESRCVNATDVEAITNICNELLERIFNFLDPDSLLNVAGTCKRLQIAAAAYYGYKFGRNIVILYSKRYCDKWSNAHVPKKGIQSISKCDGNFIRVFGSTILPFLRCFGAQISRLYTYNLTNWEIQYINRYCADTLTKIILRDVNKEAFATAFAVENVANSFKMVEYLVLVSEEIPYLGKQFSNFAFWFPNLRKLDLVTECIDDDFTPVSFPNLHELWIGGRADSYFNQKLIKRFLQANEQLRCLKIHIWNLPFSKLLDITSKQTLITKLQLYFHSSDRCAKTTQLMLRLANQHPMMVELDFGIWVIKADGAVALISRLSSLTYVRFAVKNRTEYNYIVNQLQHVIRFEGKFYDMHSYKKVELKINQRL